MAQNEYYLMHHGVKGMKWGVRRTPEQLGYKRAQKGGVDERYVNKAVRQAYALDRKANKSARQSKRQMRIEEELETYIHTNRNSAKDAALSKAIAREQNRKPSAVQTKLSDPEFQRKAARAAKIALVVGAAYATHKIVNNPEALKMGKDAIAKVMAKSGKIKTSAVESVMKTTEFKVANKVAKIAVDNSGAAKDAAKAVGGAASKVLKKIGSEETRNVITGVGAMAGTTAVIRSQIKDLKENKPDGDAFDRAIKRTQQLSEIGENVNTLARGPKGATAPTTSSTSTSSSSSSSSSNISSSIKNEKPSKKGVDKNSKEYQDLFKGQDATTRQNIKSLVNQGYDIDQIKKHLNHSAVSNSSSGHGQLMQDSKTGRVVRTNKPLTIKESKQISDYQRSHPNKNLEQTLDDLGLLDKKYVQHSSIQTGWHFNRAAKNYYIF